MVMCLLIEVSHSGITNSATMNEVLATGCHGESSYIRAELTLVPRKGEERFYRMQVFINI